MDSALAIMDRRKWLLRLIIVRVVVFTVFVAFYLNVDMLVLLAAVYALSLCWLALIRLNQKYVVQAYAQTAVDLLLITWTVNRTGGVDSYFSSLYFLSIVMSSILLEKKGAFLTATASSVIHFAHMDLGYFGVVPTTTVAWPALGNLQGIISISIFAFCAVAFLSNFLAESWRRAGAELERSTGQVAFLRAFNDRIVDTMGTGLATTDLDGHVYLFNRAAENITGYHAAHVEGMRLWSLFPGMPAEVRAGHFDVATRRADGRETFLRFAVSPLLIDEKNTAGYVWCFDDVTEVRLLERQIRQKEQMARIGVMSAGIAHEIRNPLASITGSFKILRDDLQLTDSHGQLVEIISRETERLNRTITNFLQYARPLAPHPESVELDALVAETVQLIRNSPEVQAEHRIETDLSPVRARVDESMMRQVLYNLASNALRAMPDGGTLTVGVQRRNGGARIRFSDTGVGMTEQEIENLFVPFNSSFRNGTGLGLPIVYQIVTAHGGNITVSSTKGKGTAFVIDI